MSLTGVKEVELEEKVGQRLMIGIHGTSLDGHTREHLKRIQPGSVILFSRNIETAGQVKEPRSRSSSAKYTNSFP
jgi:beta-N-acetylhexosaminidase